MCVYACVCHVVRTVARLVRVLNLEVEHPANVDLHVVLRDGRLVRDGEGLLLEHVLVGDTIDEGHHHVEPRVQCPLVLAESLHDPLLGVRNEHEQMSAIHTATVLALLLPRVHPS